jgi:dUTP pyrophosphatase
MLDKVHIKLLNKAFYKQYSLPKQATLGSAGFDLLACIEAPQVIEPNQASLVATGLACYIANPAYAGLILPRSGLGHKHGIILGNGIGLIDADYQGPLKVSLWNRSSVAFTLQPGMRMAQLMFIPVATPEFCVVDTFVQTERGVGGFGSTGVHGSQPKEVIHGE